MEPLFKQEFDDLSAKAAEAGKEFDLCKCIEFWTGVSTMYKADPRGILPPDISDAAHSFFHLNYAEKEIRDVFNVLWKIFCSLRFRDEEIVEMRKYLYEVRDGFRKGRKSN